MTPASQEPVSIEDEAAAAYFQPMQGEWTQRDQDALEARLSADPAYAAAYRRVEKVWAALGTHAESPQLLARRQEAIAYARKVSGRRWLRTSPYTRGPWRAAAAVAGVALAVAAAWQVSPYGYRPGQYHTGIGEQRIVELEDHSRIELDAATSLRVHYSADARIIDLKQGQAQFSVAEDPVRPFRVKVGDRTIIALGTVFTVEFTGQKIHVAMMEGRVAVVADSSPNRSSPDLRLRSPTTGEGHPKPSPLIPLKQLEREEVAQKEGETIELSAGEELRVGRDGRTTLIPKADIEVATAWREHKVIFRTEPLGEAVQRLNRYSRVQIEIADDSLANQEISGVFDVGDTQGFVRDIQRYLPVTADSTDFGRIKLRLQ